MNYLPDSLTVLGGGIIACAYSSIFQLLGVRVTVIDRSKRPLHFLDPEMTEEFLKGFRGSGGRFLSDRRISEVGWDGVSKVNVELVDGDKIESEKMLVAIGRQANLDGLGVESAGLEVDRCCKTSVPPIYAVGDAAAPPDWRPRRWSRVGVLSFMPLGWGRTATTRRSQWASTRSPRWPLWGSQSSRQPIVSAAPWLVGHDSLRWHADRSQV